MPPSLVDYYIISGSGIADKISNSNLREDFEDILGLGQMGYFEKTLQVVQKTYQNKQKQITSQREELQEIFKDIDDKEKQIEEYNKTIDEDREELTKTKSVLESNDNFLQNHAVDQELWNQIDLANTDLNKAKTSKTSALKKVVEKSSDIWRGYAHERILSDGDTESTDHFGVSFIKSLNNMIEKESKIFNEMKESQKSLLKEILKENTDALKINEENVAHDFSKYAKLVGPFREALAQLDSINSEIATQESLKESLDKRKINTQYDDSVKEKCKQFATDNNKLKRDIDILEGKINANKESMKKLDTEISSLRKKSTKSNQTNLSNDEKIYHITTKLLEITKDAMNIARAN